MRRHSFFGVLSALAGRTAFGFALLLIGGGRAVAQDPGVGKSPQSGPISHIGEYWRLSPAEKSREQVFDLSCAVTFFDPFWRVMFVQDRKGDAAYVPYGSNQYPFKAGEAIRARGRFLPPTIDISFAHAEVERVGPANIVPLEATETITQHARYINRYVTAEGYVDRVRRTDEPHLQLILSVSGETVYCWVMMDPRQPTPDLTDRLVRVQGVYNPKIGPDGALTSLELMIPSLAQVSVQGHLDTSPGFALPATPIKNLAVGAERKLVRVVGTVIAREPGRYVRIRDSGGQVDLATGQMRSLSINDVVEAVGYPAINGVELRLENALFRNYSRPGGNAVGEDGSANVIGLAADILKLSADEAASGRPVWLTGAVTWSHPRSPFFFIRDSSGGVCVMRGDSTSSVRSPGRNLEVRGITGMGAFAPVVIASSFERVSEAVLPVAPYVSVEHAMTGVEEAQWVEMRGYLRRIYRDENWNYLELATATRDFTAVLPLTEDLSHMVGSLIRLHGVCTAEADAQRKLTGIKLWVPGITYVQEEEPAPADPFSVPARSLATLGQYETVHAFNRRVRVSGVVLHQSPGHSIRLAENGHALLILSRADARVQPGDRLEAVGFLGRQGSRLTLREAVYRVTGHGAKPIPQSIEPMERPDAALDGQLVTIRGVLVDAGAIVGGDVQFTVQTRHKFFDATLELPAGNYFTPAEGSEVELTGVYEVNEDEHGRPEVFALRLRSLDDVKILEVASWWTRARILAFTGVLALGALLFIGWITVLRRQVHRQTSLIREQMERESRMQSELARVGKLESLGLLAGGIAHDFNNLLTVLMGNISLIRLDGSLSADVVRSLSQAEKAATRARDLTQQLLTFAKGGAPLRTAVSLGDVVREVAEFAVRGSKVRCQFEIPAELWPANVDKGQIGQVVQNIVINASQALPEGGVVKIVLGNCEKGDDLPAVLSPGRYVRIDFVDRGPGIAASDLGRIFDPYFTTKANGSGLGLATVHSIVKKHLGHISVESERGRGTTFRVWLPAADTAVTTTTEFRSPSRSPVSPNESIPRILLMDDEEFIRDLGSSILRRFGYQPKAVADGAAALEEYSRARAEGNGYDLVILDLTIPGGMGGRQTIEELLKLDPSVRAIVSSGYSNDLVLSNYQSHGFRGIVSKPYDITDFAHAVERVLRGDRA